MPTWPNASLPPLQIQQSLCSLDLHYLAFWELTTWDYKNLSSPFWRLYWNSRDDAAFHFGGEWFSLKPDTIYLIPPHKAFSTKLNENHYGRNLTAGKDLRGAGDVKLSSSLKHFFIHFSLTPFLDQQKNKYFSIPIDSEIKPLVDNIINKYLSANDSVKPLEVFSSSALVFACLSKSPEASYDKKIWEKTTQLAIQYFQENISEKIEIQDIAEKLDVSKSSFNKSFSEDLGVSPKQYLQKLRMEKALSYLKDKSIGIDEIASLCGYSDRFHFSKAFKLCFDLSPAAYRSRFLLT